MEPSSPVVRVGPDRFDLRLEAHERRLLGSLVGELRAALDAPAGMAPGGMLARLYPPAFPDDPAASAEFADLVHADLTETRRDRLDVIEATIDTETLDERTATCWLGALNDVRLVLGSSLGIEEEEPADEPEATAVAHDQEAMRHAVYAYLGWIVGGFTDALAAGLPEVPDEDDAESAPG